MHLNQLRRFLVVAEAGNLRRAALQLHVTQPALTQSLHALEHTLGERLFDRGTRGVTLTDFGRALLPRARLILNERERIAADLASIRDGKAARLTVGVGPYFTRHLFPTAAARTLEKFAGAQLDIVDAHTSELATMLLEGSIDLAFCVHNPRLDTLPELQFEDIYSERYSVMARAGHPLARRARDAELNDYDWIVPDVQITAGFLQRLFEQRELPPPRWTVSTLSLSAMVGMLANSDLLALLPQDFAQPDIAAGRIVRLPGITLAVLGRAGLLTRRDAAVGAASAELVRQLRRVCADARPGRRKPAGHASA